MTISATSGSYAEVVDCKGNDRSHLVAPATVRITRAGSTSGDLAVDVTWSGSAITGADPGSRSRPIPDGATYATVDVGDGVGDITATLVDTAGYAAGAPGTVTTSIA
ncbi:MAG: hypothetical protein U0P45_02735 [Acidimicrobiales bacterium]